MYLARRFLLFILILLLFSFTIPAYQGLLFSTKFVDEEENFAIGKYLTKGEVVYEDIVTNHLPMTHLLSALLQKRDNPTTTYDLIKDQRTAIITWSLIWSVILVYYFGLAGFIFSLIFELTRIHFYGNLFLAETLTAYPLAFLTGLAIFKKTPLKPFELFITGILLGFLSLNLGPVWPAIFFLTLIFLKEEFKNSPMILLGGLLVFLLVLPFVNIPGYFRYYILGNMESMIPRTLDYWIPALGKSFASPILSFQGQALDDNLRLIRTLSAISIINLVYLTFKKKFALVAAIIILLGLLNLRSVPVSIGHADGFHLLPWYTVLIFITSGLFVQQLKSKSSYLLKIVNVGLLILALFFTVQYAKQNLFIKKDAQSDYQVYFSTHTKIGESIKSMKKEGDTLFVFADAWLVYWQSDMDHIPKLFGYYTWMAGIPEIHQAVNKAFVQYPPTYFYCEGCMHTDLYQYLEKYKEAKGYESQKNLFILQ